MEKTTSISVPYGKSVHGQAEIDAVVEVLKTSTQMGKKVRAMEERVARLYDKAYGIMVNSGSSALYLAAELLDYPPGTEIITPVLTFSTTVSPLYKKGWIPVYVDVEEGTYNIDVDQVEAMISPKTRAMFIPNLIGNLPDWARLREIADRHGLFLLEDSADTIGAEMGGRSSGRFTDMSTTSFYGSHIINCAGNGGMLCVNDEAYYNRARLLRSWGRSSSLYVDSESIENRFHVEVDGIRYDSKFVFEEPGYNWEPSELGAAFGLVQLDKLAENIDQRTAHFQRLSRFFSRWSSWFVLPRQLPDSRTGWLALALTIRPEAPFERRDMQVFLEKRNIQTRTIFTGNILRQPGFRDLPHRARPQGYPQADQVMRGGILLACHHGLSEEQIQHLEQSVEEFLAQYS